MKNNKITIIMILLFFIGLSLLLYPSISNFYNQKKAASAIVDYESILKNSDYDKYNKMLKKAEEYNKKLFKLKDPLITYKTIGEYKDILNLNNTGMIGYIKINKIKVELPIYNGTSKEVLSKAVGHLEGTSLPVGGPSTHSVLSAHRGLPSSILFTNLDKMEIGDTFIIKVLNKEITYQVDKIQIVKPSEINPLEIEKDKDYITLLTCTPYGINTHRLLVRGVRIEDSKKEIFITTEAYKVSKSIVTLCILIPIIFLLLIILILTPDKQKKKQIKEKYIYPSKYKK